MLERIQTVKVGRKRWRLLAPFSIVPAGFEFDGASVPRLFWAFMDPASEAFEASCLHDWRLSRGMRWDHAARLFRRDLIAYGVPRWRASVAYYAVILWGRVRGG